MLNNIPITPHSLLVIFIILRLIQHLAEECLSIMNRRHYLNIERQQQAAQTLGIDAADLQKTLAYAKDKFVFARVSSWTSIAVTLFFLALGGLGWAESIAQRWAQGWPATQLLQGLFFFAVLGILNMLADLPFEAYFTFKIEEKHGFNRQTVRGFFLDKLKAIGIAVVLGGLLLCALLSVMDRMGSAWWVYAWITVSGFSLLTVWIYPTLLAPLFNKFWPLPNGDLKERILRLADKIGFRTSGLFMMDASKRSAHGNAYFTGMFGKKRIVLFDTLVGMLTTEQTVAVMAHELGHFKLHHIRWEMIRSVLFTGLMFYALSLCLPRAVFYEAFSMKGVSSYGALAVFGLWFGPISFCLKPFLSHFSRRNEFAADRFAALHLGSSEDLKTALLKLREKSQSIPIAHPLFSLFYYSHPPMLERIKAMG